jgi:hypothetical protein
MDQAFSLISGFDQLATFFVGLGIFLGFFDH